MPLASLAATWLFVALARTWRIEYAVGQREGDARGIEGGGCIYAFWHARLLPLVFTHRHRGDAVLISRNRDGEWLARVLALLGFVTARGSSTRGAEAAVLTMLEFGAHGHSLAITPDGPRGPARRVKPGLLFVAGRSGLPVVPIATAARSVWVLRSWDRFRVPKPFARVRIAYGPPIAVPADLDEAAEREWCEKLGAVIEELTQRTGRAAGEPA